MFVYKTCEKSLQTLDKNVFFGYAGKNLKKSQYFLFYNIFVNRLLSKLVTDVCPGVAGEKIIAGFERSLL